MSDTPIDPEVARRERYVWREGDVTLRPADHPVCRARELRWAQNLPTRGWSDEELLAWVAEQPDVQR